MTAADPHTEDRLDPNTLSIGCAGCPELQLCGGYTRAGGGWDCMDECREHCDPTKCTLTCMRRRNAYTLAHAQVRGFGYEDIPTLGCAVGLPRHVPVLEHDRLDDVGLRWAAIPLHVLLRHRGGPRLAFESPELMRAAFGLPGDARVVLSCVGPDRPLERFWENHRRHDLVEQIAALGFAAVIAPNFSYFLGNPRVGSGNSGHSRSGNSGHPLKGAGRGSKRR
jgi:hypothetical protein